MLKLMDKKIIEILCWNILLIWTYGVLDLIWGFVFTVLMLNGTPVIHFDANPSPLLKEN